MRLSDRLLPLCNLENGTLFTEPSGGYHVVVTKEDQHICLWLFDQGNASTGVIQSELDLADPLKLVDAYTQAALLGLLWTPSPRYFFTTGLGGGCLPTVLRHHLPTARIQCVEADAIVVDVAQRYFGFCPDENLRIAVGDGRRWLEENESTVGYDILFLDAFQDNGDVPWHLTTSEFFRLCRSSLSEQGVLIINLLYLDPHRRARIKTVATVFNHLYLCAMDDENDVLFASQQPLPDETTTIKLATRLQEYHRFPFPYVRRALKLTRLTSDEIDGWLQVPILTDSGG